jgi:hypothetical protein
MQDAVIIFIIFILIASTILLIGVGVANIINTEYIIFFVLLCLILLVVFISLLEVNPQSTEGQISTVPSTVTYTSLGKRGDMGNQMFQIACVMSAAKRSDARVVLPTILSTLPIYELFDLSSIEIKDVKVHDYYSEYDNYEQINIPKTGQIYDIRGYRQATKYFEDTRDDIRQLFTPKPELLDKMRVVLPNEFIAVHIRRGDYMKMIHKVPLLREFRRCQLAYYINAITKLRQSRSNCPVLICTDSPEWVKPLLSQLDGQAVLAPVPKDIKPKFADFCTLYLASAVVISNSTYSWWAAYLRSNREIIAPTPWWDPDGFIGSAYRLHGNWLHFKGMQLLDADSGEERTMESRRDDTPVLPLYKIIRGAII